MPELDYQAEAARESSVAHAQTYITPTKQHYDAA